MYYQNALDLFKKHIISNKLLSLVSCNFHRINLELFYSLIYRLSHCPWNILQYQLRDVTTDDSRGKTDLKEVFFWDQVFI